MPRRKRTPEEQAANQARLQELVAETLNDPPLIFQWNEEYQVLVDEQGIMHPRSNLVWMAEKIKAHCQHSNLELEAIARRTVEECGSNVAEQFNFDYFKD